MQCGLMRPVGIPNSFQRALAVPCTSMAVGKLLPAGLKAQSLDTDVQRPFYSVAIVALLPY